MTPIEIRELSFYTPMNITKVHMSARRTFNHPYEPYANFQFGYTVEAHIDGPEEIDQLRAHVETVAEVHKQDILHDLKLDRERGAVEELLADAEKWPEEMERQQKAINDIRAAIAESDNCPKNRSKRLRDAAFEYCNTFSSNEDECLIHLQNTEKTLLNLIAKAPIEGLAHVEELKASLATFPPRRLLFTGLEKRVHPGHPDHPATSEEFDNAGAL